MPGKVYAVASGKGGVGKTTTVVNLGVALRVDGRSVALVDADLGMANLAAFLGLDHEPTIHDVLADEAAVEDAVTESADGFAVVPGDRSLDAFAAADPAGLDEVLEHVAERYDVVLVDTGAGVGYDELLPLGLVDGAVLVTTPNGAAAGDTRKTARLVERLGRSVRGVVVSRADEGVDGEAIADALDVPLLGVVPEDTVLTESTAAGTPARSIEPEAAAVAAYDRVASRLRDAEPAPVPAERESAVDDAGSSDTSGATSGTDDDESATAGASVAPADEGEQPVSDEGEVGDGEGRSPGDTSATGAADERATVEAAAADGRGSASTDAAPADRVDGAEAGASPDGADADEEPASGADAASAGGFVATDAGGGEDATATTDGDADGTESATATVLAEGDGSVATEAGDDPAVAGDGSDEGDDPDEASGGLFSWFSWFR